MNIDKSGFTKLERKELRRLAALAYERDLGRALEQLEENFKQWKEKKLTALELNDLIHRYHNGIARQGRPEIGRHFSEACTSEKYYG